MSFTKIVCDVSPEAYERPDVSTDSKEPPKREPPNRDCEGSFTDKGYRGFGLLVGLGFGLTPAPEI